MAASLTYLGVALVAVVCVRAQLNPLGRFGRCINAPVDAEHCLPENEVWYLQYRTDNPDHCVHTCQAQYEKTTSNVFNSLLYYYNKGKMVNNPQAIKYHKVRDGEYYRGITVDGAAVCVRMCVLHYDPVKKYRIVYYCTDDENANPDIFNVNISTLDQEPCNLDEVHSDAVARLASLSCQLDVPLMRVEQSVQHCEPLNVKTG